MNGVTDETFEERRVRVCQRVALGVEDVAVEEVRGSCVS